MRYSRDDTNLNVTMWQSLFAYVCFEGSWPSTTSAPPTLREYCPRAFLLFLFLFLLLPPRLPPSEQLVDPLTRHYLPLLVTLNLK